MASVPAFELLRNPPDEANLPPVSVLFGDEPFLKGEAARSLVRAALGGGEDDLSLSRMDGAAESAARVFDEVRTLPFLSKRRVVVVDPADEFVTKNREALETYVAKPSRSGMLILSVKSWPSNTKLYKAVDKTGLAVDCKAPRESETPAFLVQLTKARHGLTLEPDAARLMVELVGPEVGLLASELDKLAAFVGTRSKIGREDVAKMVGSGRVEEIWKVIDEATLGDAPGALKHLDALLDAGEPPIKILAAMTSSLLKTHHAGMLRLRGRNPREAAEEAGIMGFLAEKTSRQHAHLGPARVARLPAWLLETDLDLKGYSQLPPRAILERLILRLASPRRDD